MRRKLCCAGAAASLLLACGEVPTFDGGIAYITEVILPSPAVAAGDVLRDSLGNPAALSVKAYDRNDNLIPGVTASYLVSTLPAGVSIDARGKVTAFDSVRTVQIVARIGDRLQTSPATLEVVAQPDSIASSGAPDSLKIGGSSVVSVRVSGSRGGARVGVRGIVVRFQIVSATPAQTVDPTRTFFTDGISGNLLRAVDTTDASGGASRTATISSTTGLDAVTIEASATSLKGAALTGSPVRFTIPVKKGT